MKYVSIFQKNLNCSDKFEVFQYFKNTLTDSITIWNYFVDWKKVLGNLRKIEVNLKILNYLIGKDNIEEEFSQLLNQYPEVISVIPILLACRTSNFNILTSYTENQLIYNSFNFKHKISLEKQEIEEIIVFTKKTGILELFKSKTIKNIPDYVLGVEVGLDSNARKNRGGTTMEILVNNILQAICHKHDFLLMSQATSPKLQKDWGVTVQVDKSTRRFDFAVMNEDTLYLIETNFYGGGGSKLKATAGEYKGLFDFISAQGHKFIWITDGLGWKSSLRPLEETFNHIDYTLNLKMVSEELLREIILQKL